MCITSITQLGLEPVCTVAPLVNHAVGGCHLHASVFVAAMLARPDLILPFVYLSTVSEVFYPQARSETRMWKILIDASHKGVDWFMPLWDPGCLLFFSLYLRLLHFKWIYCSLYWGFCTSKELSVCVCEGERPGLPICSMRVALTSHLYWIALASVLQVVYVQLN